MILTKNIRSDDIKQKNTTTKKSLIKLKKNKPFTYILNKRFKEDSLQPPNLRGDIEHKMTVEKASKIVKISYTYDIQNKLVSNKINDLDTNGSVF